MLKDTLFSVIAKRELVWEMAMRDLKGLNQGAFLGWLWLILGPLVQTMAYVVIVSFVLKAGGGKPLDYAIYVLSGMIPWQIMMRSLAEAPSLIRARMELVKQVIYPIETLPITSLIVSAFGSAVTLLIFVILSLTTGGASWTMLLLPVPFVLLLLFVLGVSWIFMIVGVILKDLREMVSIVLGLLVYLSPVVVRESMVGPEVYRYILWNPLAHVVICFRDVFNGSMHPVSWGIFVGMTLAVVVIGSLVITKTKTLINEYI